VRANSLSFTRGSHAETEQRWDEREWWEGKLEQGRTQLGRRRQIAGQEQQCAGRVRIFPLEQLAQRVELLRFVERTACDRAGNDFPRFDPSGTRLSHGRGRRADAKEIVGESRTAQFGDSAADWRRLGERYLERTARWRVERPRFTNKLPSNWLYAGAILAMLPGARIVACRRDPLETCFACYRQMLNGNEYTHSFSDLAAYWRDFDRAIRHWKATDPQRWIAGMARLWGRTQELFKS